MIDLRQAAEQALAFTMRDFATVRDFEAARARLQGTLRAALVEPAEFNHGIGDDRFKVVRGAYWWHVLIGDSPTKRGKFHTQAGAEEMAALLLREFKNGAFVQHKAALAEPEGGGNLPPPLQVPPEVAAALTTTDLAWLETRRLTRLWTELGQMRWAGADEGWNRAIEAVRSRLNDECQAVLDWKAKVDQSQAIAIELLRKMQGVKDD